MPMGKFDPVATAQGRAVHSPCAGPAAGRPSLRRGPMKPIPPTAPFPYSPNHPPPAPALAGRCPGRAMGDSQHRVFSLMEKVPAARGPGTPVPDIPSWSARDYGNRVGVFSAHAGAQPLWRAWYRRAQQRSLRAPSEIIAEGQKLGWEWIGHCESNTRRLNERRPARKRGSSSARSRPSPRPAARARSAGSAPVCRRPGTRSTCSPPKAASMCATGPMTTSPMR
jgi:hypothetical protein